MRNTFEQKTTWLGFVSTLAFLAMVLTLTACGQPSTTSSGTTTSTVSKPTVPFTALRMSDRNNGWALTARSVFKTSDGGMHWQDVTPMNAGINSLTRADFATSQYAWIAIPTAPTIGQAVKVLRTADGGASWQSTMIHDGASAAVDCPHFLGNQEGWIETFALQAMSHVPTDIWHSTDGGATWTQVHMSGTYMLLPSGISYENSQDAIMAGDLGAYQVATRIPGIAMTYDGGKDWQMTKLSIPQGIAKTSSFSTAPPVFFGKVALLPVYMGQPDGFVLYRSNDSGQHWSLTHVVHINASAVTVLDTNHAWVMDTNSDQLYATTDGGTSWNQITTTAHNFTILNFIDATNGWGVTTSGFYHTTDGGKTWQQVGGSMQKL
jgi:photosystem II stability/assembly factor-like uncharacterized protein